MKTLFYVIAVISMTITSTKGQSDNPSTHQNGALVNDERCGSQPSIEEAVPFTSYPKGVQRVEPGEYPWVVMLSIENVAHFVGESPYTTCMGSIISKRFVLTASSCFSLYGTENNSPRPRSIIISAGEIDLSTTPHCDDYTSCPLNVYIGESVKYYRDNGPAEGGKNIALVKTTQPIFFHDTVLPICLQHDALLYPSNFWGEIGIRVTASDQNLQQVGGHILSEEENTKLHESHLPGDMHSEDVNSVFGIGGTAAEVYHDSDIGGPLMIKKPIDNVPPRFYLYGIRSFKAETAVPPYASTFVYTKVSHYLEWILDNISE
uniref:Seminal fluid protein n=1 Tax=Nilaparvata lugens TaxID=108931 RepID=A0A1I9WL75_NILLU|nr:seminal fluid protein [Nilaparvata lugens]